MKEISEEILPGNLVYVKTNDGREYIGEALTVSKTRVTFSENTVGVIVNGMSNVVKVEHPPLSFYAVSLLRVWKVRNKSVIGRLYYKHKWV